MWAIQVSGKEHSQISEEVRKIREWISQTRDRIVKVQRALKVRAANRWNGRTGENKLRGLDPEEIAVMGAEPGTATGIGKSGPQMRIGALKLVGLHYVRQHLREQFDKHTS